MEIRMVSMCESSAKKAKNSSGTKKADLKWLDHVVKRWSAFENRGLQSRHEIGKLLNENLGTPDKRLKLGGQVLKMAAERMKISESEISRMRWLAFLFTDIPAMQKDHPECMDWTRFKSELPAIRESRGYAVKKRKASGAGSPFTAIRRSASNVRGKIQAVEQTAVEEIPEPVRSELQELVEAIQSLLRQAVDPALVVEGERSLAAAGAN